MRKVNKSFINNRILSFNKFNYLKIKLLRISINKCSSMIIHIFKLFEWCGFKCSQDLFSQILIRVFPYIFVRVDCQANTTKGMYVIVTIKKKKKTTTKVTFFFV